MVQHMVCAPISAGGFLYILEDGAGGTDYLLFRLAPRTLASQVSAVSSQMVATPLRLAQFGSMSDMSAILATDMANMALSARDAAERGAATVAAMTPGRRASHSRIAEPEGAPTPANQSVKPKSSRLCSIM